MPCLFCEMELHKFCDRPTTDTEVGRCCCAETSTMEVSSLNITRSPGRPRHAKEELVKPDNAGISSVAAPVTTDIGMPEPSDSPKANNLQGKWKKLGAPMKAGTEMSNVLATGRARAKIVKPIVPGMICEWKGLRYAGGGIVPVIGCDGNPAESVHHGPDKSVLHNDPSNLHRVCQVCHERWHICNDVYYGDVRPENGEPWLPNSDLHCHRHQATIIATEDAVKYYEGLWKKIRDASRHSRHEEADSYREAIIEFVMEGAEKLN